MWLYVAFLQDELVFHMPMVLDLMCQVSFCHEDTDLWENVFELFVCTRSLDLASKYAISCPCKTSTVESEVL